MKKRTKKLLIVREDEFAALMAGLGPWPEGRRVGVAVSGGADSLALAWLLARWGSPGAFIVDHGLRAGSAGEAAETAARLAGFGVPARILTLHGLRPGAARARAARYAALTQAAGAAGIVDLLLAHHRRDQAETVLMRRLSRSGEAGLAAMAPIVETPGLRLVRPLLGIPPGRLRATLRAAGLAWVEDPSNHDPAALRARLRARLDDADGDGARTTQLANRAAAHGVERAAAELEHAVSLARVATIRPEGFAVLRPGPLPPAALASLIRAIGGNAYPPSGAALAELAAAPRAAVLLGVRLLPAGRLGAGLLVVREAAALAAPVPAHPGAMWDGRFRLSGGAQPPEGAMLGALGADAAGLRRLSDLPSAVLVTLPALRVNGVLAAVPHIGYPDPQTCACMAVLFSPASPAAGAPFGIVARGVPTGGGGPMLGYAAASAA